MQETDQKWMARAIDLAGQAAAIGEVPVGAVIVRENQLVSEAYNTREQHHTALGHAEISVISQASESLKSWRLNDCCLYVTLEPCIMCAGAILQSRIPRVVYGASDPKGGAVQSLYQLLNDSRLNHSCEIVAGVLSDPCGQMLRDFFARLRAKE